MINQSAKKINNALLSLLDNYLSSFSNRPKFLGKQMVEEWYYINHTFTFTFQSSIIPINSTIREFFALLKYHKIILAYEVNPAFFSDKVRFHLRTPLIDSYEDFSYKIGMMRLNNETTYICKQCGQTKSIEDNNGDDLCYKCLLINSQLPTI